MEQKSKLGLVLEGGAMRGLYTAGVLDVMMENGIRPDVICGTSAGVTFGVNLPSGQKGRVLRYNIANAGKKEFISLHSLLTTGNIINVPFAYDILPHVLDPFDNEAFKASGIEFYATLTNVLTGEAEYHRITDCDAQMDTIRASASMPFLSRMVMIDGILYLDGGITDNIPIDKCLDEGCEKIIVVLTKPEGFTRRGSMAPLGRIFYHKYKNLVRAFEQRNERYNNCLKKLKQLEAEGRVVIIRPSRKVNISRLESDPAIITEMYKLGIQDAQACAELVR